jgi:hypothetical protein
MQAKYNALENRSKDLLLSQGSAVSGASVALSGLGNRLELLVEQLITSYNISEQDLEVSLTLTFDVASFIISQNHFVVIFFVHVHSNVLPIFHSNIFHARVNN